MAEYTIFQQAKSIMDTFRASLKDKRVLATEEEVNRRAAICEGCEKLRAKRGRYSCVVCGCGYRRKIAFSGSSCPIEKW